MDEFRKKYCVIMHLFVSDIQRGNLFEVNNQQGSLKNRGHKTLTMHWDQDKVHINPGRLLAATYIKLAKRQQKIRYSIYHHWRHVSLELFDKYLYPLCNKWYFASFELILIDHLCIFTTLHLKLKLQSKVKTV